MAERTRRTFTPADREAMRSLWASGAPVPVIARRLNRSPGSVKMYCRRNRSLFPRRAASRRALPRCAPAALPEVKRLIGMMNEKGWTVAHLAEAAGVDRLTINWWMRGLHKPRPALLGWCFEALGVARTEDGGRNDG